MQDRPLKHHDGYDDGDDNQETTGGGWKTPAAGDTRSTPPGHREMAFLQVLSDSGARPEFCLSSTGGHRQLLAFFRTTALILPADPKPAVHPEVLKTDCCCNTRPAPHRMLWTFRLPCCLTFVPAAKPSNPELGSTKKPIFNPG